MRKFLVIAVVVLASCGGGKTDSQTVTEYCVEQINELYERHHLPFTSDPADRPAICEQWMAEKDIHTKAEIRTAVLEADKQYRELEK